MNSPEKISIKKEQQQPLVKRRFNDVLVEIDGQRIPIRELPKHEYEEFLEDMHKVRLGYIIMLLRES